MKIGQTYSSITRISENDNNNNNNNNQILHTDFNENV